MRDIAVMSYNLEIVTRMAESDLEHIVGTLTSAFIDDPLMKYLFPDPVSRPNQINSFFRINVTLGLTVGEVYGTSSNQGYAVWLFPGDRSRSRLSKADLPIERLKPLLEQESLERYVNFERYVRDRHLELVRPLYCLLLFLGVDKYRRGRGLGSSLLRPILEYSDRARLPCILDTMNRDNIPFYAGHGFKVRQEYRICGNGPQTWTMVRQPV